MLIRFAHLDRPLLHSQMRLHVLLVLPSTTASILQRTGGERAMAEAMAAPDTQREFEKAGYLVMPSACLADEIAPLRAELDAARSELTKGGYRIWTPATELPTLVREPWLAASVTSTAGQCQAALPWRRGPGQDARRPFRWHAFSSGRGVRRG